MPFYHKLGKIPPKRHTQFRKPNGELYSEQLFGTIGFDGMSSNLYHEHRPTQVKEIQKQYSVAPKIAKQNSIQSYKLRGFQITPEEDYLESRKIILTNSDCNIILAAPKTSQTGYFYKNTDADEVIFIHKGSGKLRTHMGNLNFEFGDYLVIPRGMIYKIEFDTEDNRWQGEFLIKIKKQNDIFDVVYATHPFDVVGYDGFNYPYAFSIHDFEPITGRIHQPPPVHQTFETSAFVICSFVPRLYDYHPNGIPAPYNHSNIDSDEVIYYVDGDFMSRNDVEKGHISLHPAGIPHGPHPGAVERSIGKTKTEELAVMVDTFKPLQLTEDAIQIGDEAYHKSWLDENHN